AEPRSFYRLGLKAPERAALWTRTSAARSVARALPAVQRRAPGDAAAERARQHQHPRLQHALVHRLGESERDRRRGRVAEALDRAEDARVRDAHGVGVVVVDAQIRLVD